MEAAAGPGPGAQPHAKLWGATCWVASWLYWWPGVLAGLAIGYAYAAFMIFALALRELAPSTAGERARRPLRGSIAGALQKLAVRGGGGWWEGGGVLWLITDQPLFLAR